MNLKMGCVPYLLILIFEGDFLLAKVRKALFYGGILAPYALNHFLAYGKGQ
jgi:hypothetical protein